MSTRQLARNARSGRFISIAEAYRRPATSVIEKIHVSRTGVRRLKRRTVLYRTEENQNKTSGR
jgi:cob(I)alamin adenosyltransferase